MMRSSVHFHQAESGAVLARNLAAFVAARLKDALAQRGHALLIVSGGSTPIPFFEALSGQDLDWSHVVVTLADERWLPPLHADSNERLVRAHLLKHRAAQARFVPIYNDAATPEEGLSRIEAALDALPWPAAVTVLGMGSDGHTASLFPHAQALSESLLASSGLLSGEPGRRSVAVAAPAQPNVPVPRLSLTPRALLDTRQVVVHITGAAKLGLLKQAVQAGPLGEYPIRLALHQAHVPCDVFCAP